MREDADTTGRRAAGSKEENGSILIWALLFAIITSAMIISHSTFLASNRRAMSARYENVTLSDTFARSGLTDALEWYQRQPTQPVTTFAPQNDPTGDPPLLDTLDPTVGLVREFEVRGSLWARYEIRKDDTFDISATRGLSTPGSVWDVGARSFLYLRRDPGAPFGQGGNRVVATSYLRTELQGIAIVPPASAAIVVSDPSQLEIGPNVRIEGGNGPAIAYPAGQSLPGSPAGTVAGTPPALPIAGLDTSAQHVFAMDLDRLASLSDYRLRTQALAGDSGGSVIDDVLEDLDVPGLGLPGGGGPPGGSPSGAGKAKGNGGDGRARVASSLAPAAPAPIPQSRHESWWSWYERSHLTSDRSARDFRDYSFAFRRWYYSEFRPSHVSSPSDEGNAGADKAADLLATKLDSAADTAKKTLAEIFSIDSASDSGASAAASGALAWVTGSHRYLPGRGQVSDEQRPTDLNDKAVFFDGDLVLDAGRPLVGRSLVIVRGNLQVQSDNESRVRGLLYVTGDADIEGRLDIEGMLVVGGKLRIGFGPATSVLHASAGAIGEIKQSVERYRLCRTVRPGWATSR